MYKYVGCNTMLFFKNRSVGFSNFFSPDSFKHTTNNRIDIFLYKEKITKISVMEQRKINARPKEVSFNGTIYLKLEGTYAVAVFIGDLKTDRVFFHTNCR